MNRRLAKPDVDEGTQVEPGKTLAELDPVPFQQDVAAATAEVAMAQAQFDRATRGFRKEEIAQAKSAVEAAQAKVQWIRTQLDETVIKAPADALVEKLDIESGDLVSAGKPVALLVRTGSLWVRTYLPQAQLRYARPGTKANVRVDAYPGTDFDGVIRRINMETDSTPGKLLSSEERALPVVKTEVMIAEAPKDEEHSHGGGMPPGGMGGMDM